MKNVNIKNGEQLTFFQEVIDACYKLLSRHSAGQTEEKHEKSFSGPSAIKPCFEPVTYGT
jgi:hypothetical protein